MQAWPGPTLPVLPGTGPGIRLTDTYTGAVSPVAVGAQARLYVCGITPYDATHLGHAFTFVTADLLVRALHDEGCDVRYVQNVTDVDDPLLERAVAYGEDWRAVAERETELFRSDMAALRVVAPTDYVGVVESLDLMVEFIVALRERGAAYEVGSDVYFDIATDPRRGRLASRTGRDPHDAFVDSGGDPGRAGKRHPLDPLIWQAARPDEPAWESALGRGRPGWHVECAAIAHSLLGVPFDVQAGGSDLAFPHHDLCASLSFALTGVWPYARTYLHAGMVGLDGHKMSKSRGNLVLVSDVGTEDRMALRLALLQHHYRSDWDWHGTILAAARSRLARWHAAVARPSGPRADRVVAEVRAAIADDLDAPAALRAVDVWVAAAIAGAGDDREAPAVVAQTVDALLGISMPGIATP